MSSCATGTSWKTLTRSGAIVVVFGLGLASSGVSYAADGGASTVRALIGGDGKVTSVSRLGGDTNAKPSAADLPITLAITKAGSTVTYAVQNTTTKSESVSVTDAAGKVKTVQQDVQTPYVAMLHVSLPKSLTNVVAPGASVITNSDGSHDLTWSMVLFAPIGSPTQTVTYTASGTGNPVARLESQAVSPNGTPGLSATGQAANATVAGNGTLNALTAGANTGLDQLAAGVAQIVAGLEKLSSGATALHTGLAAGSDGTKQLADGLHTAHTGSTSLSSGLGKIAAGTGQLAPGASALKVGTGKLLAGLDLAATGSDKLVDGSQDLAAGAGLLAGQLPGLEAGVNQLIAAIHHAPLTGGATDPGGIQEVLSSVLNGLDAQASATAPLGGAKQVLITVQKLLGCSPLPAPSACSAVVPTPVGPPFGTSAVLVQQALVGLIGGLGSRDVPANSALFALQSVVSGIGSATQAKTVLGGLAQLGAGSHAAATGAAQIAAGAGKLSEEGAVPISQGLHALAAGQREADAGAAKLASGAGALNAGAQAAFSGSKDLNAGIAKISAGEDKVAAGLPAAVTGSAQIADGASQLLTGNKGVAKGLSDVKAQATGVLASQLAAGTENAQVQLAALDASSARLTSNPAVANTTYVLTQEADGSTSALKLSGNSSHTGRNIGLGLGGAALLLGGLGAGFASGRRRPTS